MNARSYQPMLLIMGKEEYSHTRRRFATEHEASEYGIVMMFRSFLVSDWKVIESSDPVNCRWNRRTARAEELTEKEN